MQATLRTVTCQNSFTFNQHLDIKFVSFVVRTDLCEKKKKQFYEIEIVV